MSIPWNTANSEMVTNTMYTILVLRPAITYYGEIVKSVPDGNSKRFVVSVAVFDNIIAPMIVTARYAHAEKVFNNSVSSILTRVDAESAKCETHMLCKLTHETLSGTNYIYGVKDVIFILTLDEIGRMVHIYTINNPCVTTVYRPQDHEFLGKVSAAMMSGKLEWVTLKDARTDHPKLFSKFMKYDLSSN